MVHVRRRLEVIHNYIIIELTISFRDIIVKCFCCYGKRKELQEELQERQEVSEGKGDPLVEGDEERDQDDSEDER